MEQPQREGKWPCWKGTQLSGSRDGRNANISLQVSAMSSLVGNTGSFPSGHKVHSDKVTAGNRAMREKKRSISVFGFGFKNI